MQILSKPVGIDLGTTNSAVAVMDPTDTELIIHRDPNLKSETTPSCVWRNTKSGEIIVGRQAFRRIGTEPSPIRSIKRLMGRQTKVRLSNEDASPDQISAYILGEMRRQIETDVARFSGDSAQWIVDRAVITVPAYFDQPQVEATRRAGELANLEVLDLLHEPTAAACYHCWRSGQRAARHGRRVRGARD
jgi:molecular chaperone DnaK